MRSKPLIPKENIEADGITGTKGRFVPILEDWFRHGYSDWCEENIPPKAFNFVDRLITKFILGRGRTLEGRLQRKLRVATVNTFYSLLDEGKFLLGNDDDDEHEDSARL